MLIHWAATLINRITGICFLRLSRFHRSAGLDDTPSSGRNSPVLSASPSSSKFAFEVSPNMAYPNPRYPPYPTPTIVKPLAQLRQPLLQNLIGKFIYLFVSSMFVYMCAWVRSCIYLVVTNGRRAESYADSVPSIYLHIFSLTFNTFIFFTWTVSLSSPFHMLFCVKLNLLIWYLTQTYFLLALVVLHYLKQIYVFDLCHKYILWMLLEPD